MKKRLFALVLVLTMVLGLLPVTAAAEDGKLYGEVPIYLGFADVDYMAEQVLKVVISGKYRKDYDKFQKVPLEKMPEACREDCISEKELYGADSQASTTSIDLDSDGSAEMIVTYRSYWGNGGTRYDILTKRDGKWIKSDKFYAVFWQPLKINGRIGLFLDNKCGWAQRDYSFVEFKNGKLTPAVVIDLQRYADKKKPSLTITVNAAEEDSDMNYLF